MVNWKTLHRWTQETNGATATGQNRLLGINNAPLIATFYKLRGSFCIFRIFHHASIRSTNRRPTVVNKSKPQAFSITGSNNRLVRRQSYEQFKRSRFAELRFTHTSVLATLDKSFITSFLATTHTKHHQRTSTLFGREAVGAIGNKVICIKVQHTSSEQQTTSPASS